MPNDSTIGAIALPGAPLPMSTAPAPRADDPRMAQMRHAAEEFEAVFIAQMMAPMFEGLDTDGLGGGGIGEETFRPMLIEQYGQALSKAGGVGIADSIVRELMRMQETAPAPEDADGAHR
jgi:Rod binding domain-containing protein